MNHDSAAWCYHDSEASLNSTSKINCTVRSTAQSRFHKVLDQPSISDSIVLQHTIQQNTPSKVPAHGTVAPRELGCWQTMVNPINPGLAPEA